AAVPQLAVVALIFFAIEQGLSFAAESAFWTIPGMCATLSVFLGYLVGTELVPAPRPASIATGIALGTLCFLVSATLLSFIPLTRWSVLPLAAIACFGTTWIVRKLPDTATLRRVTASPRLLAVRATTPAGTGLPLTGAPPPPRPHGSGPPAR